MQRELRGGVNPGTEPWSRPESDQGDEKTRTEVLGGRHLRKEGKPKDTNYNTGGQGKKGGKNLKKSKHWTQGKEKKQLQGNPRPRTGRDDLKLGLRSVLYLKDLNAAYWFSTFRANLQSRVITRQAEQQQKNKTKIRTSCASDLLQHYRSRDDRI